MMNLNYLRESGIVHVYVEAKAFRLAIRLDVFLRVVCASRLYGDSYVSD